MLPMDLLNLKSTINFIKLDVEGMELQALQGMSRLKAKELQGGGKIQEILGE